MGNVRSKRNVSDQVFFSLVPFSFLSSATARAITTFEIAMYYKNGPSAKKTVSALSTHLLHPRGTMVRRWRDIETFTHVRTRKGAR